MHVTSLEILLGTGFVELVEITVLSGSLCFSICCEYACSLVSVEYTGTLTYECCHVAAAIDRRGITLGTLGIAVDGYVFLVRQALDLVLVVTQAGTQLQGEFAAYHWLTVEAYLKSGVVHRTLVAPIALHTCHRSGEILHGEEVGCMVHIVVEA